MRPLFHPSIDDVTVEGLLHALADPVRAAIYAGIVGADGSQSCSNSAGAMDKSIPKSTLSQHFRILRESGLIRGERHGVEMLNTARCAEIEKRFPGLIVAILNAHRIQSAGARRAAPKSRRKAAKKRRASPV